MALKSALHDIVETWNKKDSLNVGDKLTGFYARVDKFQTRAFGEAKKYIIVDENGENAMGVMSQAVIERAFMNIPVGCYVEITYNGKVQSSNGQMVNDYDVKYDDDRKIALE